ncbi:hypothetical protein B0H14DRAFT_3454150 [Mycena olivaceomarginata]|nr:hypothetical protein B0H14DRAFT_3454150 [Mycena olivaceomarginata]
MHGRDPCTTAYPIRREDGASVQRAIPRAVWASGQVCGGLEVPRPKRGAFRKGAIYMHMLEKCMAPWMWMCGFARVGGGVLCRMYEHVKCQIASTPLRSLLHPSSNYNERRVEKHIIDARIRLHPVLVRAPGHHVPEAAAYEATSQAVVERSMLGLFSGSVSSAAGQTPYNTKRDFSDIVQRVGVHAVISQ